jgi:hypothetical protein
VGRTLHNILVEVLLCIVEAMGLAVSCQPRGTCYRCCLVFVSTIAASLSGAKAIVADAAVAEVLALGVHALASEGFLLFAATLLGLLFLIQSTTT